MSRPLRIEFPGAVYHVTSRGNAGHRIFTDADDASEFVELLRREIAQQRWLCHAWCLMPDHYHLVVETPEPNLGRGMARLNMRYSQWFNRRRGTPGHLFAGRYKAILVEKAAPLLEVCRHVVLNPVRAGLVPHARHWRWSSYREVAVIGAGPGLSDPGWLLGRMGERDDDARRAYCRYVEDGTNAPAPWESLRSGQYLGGEAFLAEIAARVRGMPMDQVAAIVTRPDRPTVEQVRKAVAEAADMPLDAVLDRRAAREPFRVAAYLLRRACNLPLDQVARMAGVSPGRISQIQRAVEDAGGLANAFPWAAPLERLYLA